MDLQSQLLLKHDKHNMLCIREYIGSDPERFADLMNQFFSGGYRIQQRASWAVMHCVDRHPGLVGPYLEKMIDLLDQPVHDSVKRNTTRIMRHVEIPRELHGKAATHCFRLLADPASSTAIKVFSMYVLAKIVREEPELGPELRLLIEENRPHASTGFHGAARKVLQTLNQLGV